MLCNFSKDQPQLDKVEFSFILLKCTAAPQAVRYTHLNYLSVKKQKQTTLGSHPQQQRQQHLILGQPVTPGIIMHRVGGRQRSEEPSWRSGCVYLMISLRS